VARADVQALYQAILDTVNVNLAQFEKIKRFALVPKDMTIEGGELTPTMKIPAEGRRAALGAGHRTALRTRAGAQRLLSGRRGGPAVRTVALPESATTAPARGR